MKTIAIIPLIILSFLLVTLNASAEGEVRVSHSAYTAEKPVPCEFAFTLNPGYIEEEAEKVNADVLLALDANENSDDSVKSVIGFSLNINEMIDNIKPEDILQLNVR